MRWLICRNTPAREAHCMCSPCHSGNVVAGHSMLDAPASRPARRKTLRAVLALALMLVAVAGGLSAADPARLLRVAADPNNLPFSNDRGEGFENKLVDLSARELGVSVEYTWWAQRRGFCRNTLKEGNSAV